MEELGILWKDAGLFEDWKTWKERKLCKIGTEQVEETALRMLTKNFLD